MKLFLRRGADSAASPRPKRDAKQQQSTSSTKPHSPKSPRVNLKITPPSLLGSGLDDDRAAKPAPSSPTGGPPSSSSPKMSNLRISTPAPSTPDDDYLSFITPGSPPPQRTMFSLSGSRVVMSARDEKTGAVNAIFEQPAPTMPPKKAFSSIIASGPGHILSPRPVSSGRIPEFVYTSDFDESGILHYLGTNRWTTRSWTNPALLGLVQLSSSELNVDSQPLHAFIGRTACRALLSNIPNSWFVVDFKDHVVVPRNYTLRHYNSQDSHALRHWKFEGSNDGITWDILRVHKNDKSLNKRGASRTWSLDTYSMTKGKSKAYRLFRVQMTGDNSSEYFRNLCCSGFEIYGYLFEKSGLVLEEEHEEIWLETTVPVTERKGEICFTSEEFALGEQRLKEVKHDSFSFTECKLFRHENITDWRGPKDRDCQERENDPTAQVAEFIQSRLGTPGLGVRFIDDGEPPEFTDDKIRELLSKIPKKGIRKDPDKGFRKNKEHITFADDIQTTSSMDLALRPMLVTVIFIDSSFFHHGKTRGRKCPNASQREQEFDGDTQAVVQQKE